MIPKPDSQKPLHQRYQDIQHLKERMISGLRQKFEEEQDCTFKPSISKISQQVAQLRHRDKDLISRIEEEADIINKKKLSSLQSKIELEALECPFHPSLNSAGNEIVKGNIDVKDFKKQ